MSQQAVQQDETPGADFIWACEAPSCKPTHKKRAAVRESTEINPLRFKMVPDAGPDASKPTESRCHEEPNPRDDSLMIFEPSEDMDRRRSMPDIGRREKPTTGLRRQSSLVGFPPGDSEEPHHRVATALVYLFAVRTGSATTNPRLIEALQTSAAEDNAPHITRQSPELHSVSQKTFARSNAAPRARPCSPPATCADDKDYFVQGLVGSTLKNCVNVKFHRRLAARPSSQQPDQEVNLPGYVGEALLITVK